MTVLYDPSTIVAPPTPNPNSSAADWANYYAYHRLMAEFKIADSNRLLAEAQQAVAAAILHTSPAPVPAPAPSDPPAPPQPGPTPVDTLQGRTVAVLREWSAMIKPA